MRLALAKKVSTPFVSALLAVGIAVVPTVAHADTQPYFKVLGGDVFTGGWFENAGGSCNTAYDPIIPRSNYQDSAYFGPGIPAAETNGGILTFAKQSGGNSAGGSSTQYGAFSLGRVDGDSGSKGHYSAGAAAPIDKKLLTFGNYPGTGEWGGYFQGFRQSHCIPDYYDLKKPASTFTLGANSFPAEATSVGPNNHADFTADMAGQQVFRLNASQATVQKGTVLTIFVPGSVYIGDNIINELDDVDHVPKFALVAKGDIYIGKNVTRLDGWYIAQPSDPENLSAPADDSSGVIWTCHEANLDPVLDTYPNTCTNRLLVNGALTAKEVKFLRTGSSDVAVATTSEDELTAALASTNISEIINYTPAMIIGGQFFNENQNPTTTTSYKIESLVNLPPVF